MLFSIGFSKFWGDGGSKILVFGTPGDLGSLGEAGKSKMLAFPCFFKV